MITPENKVILVKRLKSLAWRAAGLIVALIVTEQADVLQLVDIPEVGRLFIGLVIGELSKYLNSRK